MIAKSEDPTVLKNEKPVVQQFKPKFSILKRRQTRFKTRNSEARRSITQFGQDANKNNLNLLKRYNRLMNL